MSHIVFDLETTGLPFMKTRTEYHDYRQLDKYSRSRVVQIAYACIDSNYNILYEKEFKIKDVDVMDSERFHHISQRELEEKGHRFDKVIDEIMTDFESCDTLIAHNINFDINVLCSELFRRGFTEFAASIRKKTLICTMLRLKHHVNVCNAYGVKYPSMLDLYRFAFGGDAEIENAHNAYYDVMALVRALKRIKEDKNICLLRMSIKTLEP